MLVRGISAGVRGNWYRGARVLVMGCEPEYERELVFGCKVISTGVRDVISTGVRTRKITLISQH